MSDFGKRVDGPQGRRQAPRQEVALLGSAMTLEGSKSVFVDDLSSTGAKVCGRGLPGAGKEILIRTDQLYLFGRVAWAHEDFRGIILQDAS